MLDFGGAMLRLVQRAASFLILAVVIPIVPMLMAEEKPSGPPTAPLPAQIIAAKKVFISNGGEDTWLDFDPKHNPTYTYNEFYAAMKTWGKYQLVSSPAEADVVFEIRLALRETGVPRGSGPELRLLILDPKTHVALWPLNQWAKGANRDATARKNFDEAMNALVESMKRLVASTQ
jgi:hypothetical protein